MVVKTTSFKLDTELVKELKIIAIKRDMQLTELVIEYLKKGIENEQIK